MAASILLTVLNLQQALSRLLRRAPHWRRGLALLISSHHYPVSWLLLKDRSLTRKEVPIIGRGISVWSRAKRRRRKGTDIYQKPRTYQTQWHVLYVLLKILPRSRRVEGCEEGGWKRRLVGVGKTAWWDINPPGMGRSSVGRDWLPC